MREFEIPVHAVVEKQRLTTSMCLAVAFGARHDPLGQGGLAHVLEHVLMSAPLDGGLSFTERVERLGGQANAETGLEVMLFYAQVHADDADLIAELLLRAVLNADLDLATLDRERAVILQELAAAEADPADCVQDAFLAAIFPGHPLGRPVAGTAAQVKAMDLPAVSDGYAGVFALSPMVLAVVGPHVPKPLEHAVRRVGEMRPGVPRAALRPVTISDPRWPEEFGWVCIGGRSGAQDDPRRHAFTILAHVLGGSPSSLLYRKLRGERGLAYAFQGWARTYAESGAWRVIVGVEQGNGPAVQEEVLGLLTHIGTCGLAPDDLDAALRQARLGLIMEAEIPLDHARMIAKQTMMSRGRWSLEDEFAELGAVTAADVLDAAAGLLPDLVTVVRPEPR